MWTKQGVGIEIKADGVWATQGVLNVAGAIEDAAGVFGTADETEAVYRAIEDAVDAGALYVDVDGVRYTWDLFV